jgi:hypothetical protein
MAVGVVRPEHSLRSPLQAVDHAETGRAERMATPTPHEDGQPRLRSIVHEAPQQAEPLAEGGTAEAQHRADFLRIQVCRRERGEDTDRRLKIRQEVRRESPRPLGLRNGVRLLPARLALVSPRREARLERRAAAHRPSQPSAVLGRADVGHAALHRIEQDRLHQVSGIMAITRARSRCAQTLVVGLPHRAHSSIGRAWAAPDARAASQRRVDALWLAVHSGSRCMGPAIRRHHEGLAARDPQGLAWLDVEEPPGVAYLADLQWAVRYAALNRRRIAERACDAVAGILHAEPAKDGWLHSDHNHVRLERHGGKALWVHRKGAQRVGSDALGVVPGSMGSPSYHVAGRDVPEALCSAAHGAGRALSRSEARRRINLRELDSQMRGIWFDARLRDAPREEAPSAYKDIGEVMRAQRELVRIVRRLDPVLVYKAV